MANAKISVIVPCYKVEKFLSACLDSILNQTLKEIEIICVNDASPDKTAEILKKYSESDSRIRVINHEKNRGLSAARNTGISLACGDYIAFVDSDDFLDLSMLEKLYKKAEKTGAEIVIGNVFLYYDGTGKTEIFRNKRFFTFLSGRIFTLTEYPALVSCIAAWDRIYKRELIKDNNLTFPEGLVYEDQPFSIMAMAYAKSITVVNEALYYYRKNSGTSITDSEKENDAYKFDFLEISAISKNFMKTAGIYGRLRKEYMRYHFFLAAVHQHNIKDSKTFRRFFDKMLEITSESDCEALCETKLEYLAERYLQALKSKNYRDFYKLTKRISFGKSILNFLIPGRRKRI